MRFMTVLLMSTALSAGLPGCGAIYHSPSVETVASDGSKVRILPVTAENVMLANRSAYHPKTLPAIFSQGAGAGSGLRGTGPTPDPALTARVRPSELEVRIPPAANPGPYRIGVGDVVLLATPRAGSTVEELSGLLAAQNSRQGYTVQDDGKIAIPDVGRVQIAGMTLEEAEDELFQQLVAAQIEPTFSLEIAEFNSRRVSVGGAVASPTVEPITLTPLYLDEALTAAGGVTVADQDYTSVRLYRDGTIYQIPLTQIYARNGLRRIQLVDGDSVFVDTEYELTLAQAYLDEARDNYLAKVDLDAVERDYVYLAGEVGKQSRFTLPYGRTATLADALYSSANGVPTATADVREIYVLRGSSDPREFAAVTAWHLDARNAANLMLATRFELRPDDVIFIAEQPVTRWNRVIQQITPSLITSVTAAAY